MDQYDKEDSKTTRHSPLLVLDLGLHVIDSVGRLDLEGDGLSGESLNEDLHVERRICGWGVSCGGRDSEEAGALR